MEPHPPAEPPNAGPEGKATLTVRQKIILEWRHYLYEFFIVALGISIPFLLDRWNQNIQDRETERQYYANLQRELAEDLEEIRGNMDYNNKYQQQYHYGSLIIADQDRTLMDTLTRITYNLRFASDFQRNSDLYETLVASGELPLIKNRQVVNELQNLQEVYTYINRLEDNHLTVLIDKIVPILIDNIHMRAFRVNDPKWLYSFQLENLILMAQSICDEKSEVYQRAEEQILHIQSLLATELD